jgi:hypothetical protein
MPRIKKTQPFHDTITGYDFRVDPPLTRTKAIRQKCLECQGGNAQEVRRCTHSDCTLWPWRLGRVARPCPSEHAPIADTAGRGASHPCPPQSANDIQAITPRATDSNSHRDGYGEQAHV